MEFQLFKGVAEVLGHKGQLNLSSRSKMVDTFSKKKSINEMDQDELGSYLLCAIGKSYKIFTKSQNREDYESAILNF